MEWESIIKAVTPLILLGIGYALNLYRARTKAQISVEDDYRLEMVAQKAILAAEEAGKREGWNNEANGGEKKRQFAADLISAAFPKLNPVLIGMAIDAALVLVDLGLSAKARRKPELPNVEKLEALAEASKTNGG